MSKHIVEAIGLSKVTIKDGKVIDVSEPKLDYCPLFHHHRGMEKITKKAIKIVSSLSSNSGGTNAKSDRQHSNTSIQDRRIFRGMCRKRIESGLHKFRDYFGK